MNQVTILPPSGPKHHGRAISKTEGRPSRDMGTVREKPGQLKGSGAELGVQNMETRICPLLSVKPECFVAGLVNTPLPQPQLKDGKMSPLATEGLVRTHKGGKAPSLTTSLAWAPKTAELSVTLTPFLGSFPLRPSALPPTHKASKCPGQASSALLGHLPGPSHLLAFALVCPSARNR